MVYQTQSLVSDINLTLKMLSLPVLMPLTLFSLMTPSVVIVSIVIVSTRKSSFHGFSINTVSNIVILYADMTGLIYPLLLLYVNKHVWKDMMALLLHCP